MRSVLKSEVQRYNSHQVHSTTREIPNIRFVKAWKEGNSLFRKFALPKPYTSPQDVFCLRTTRIVNGYRRISLYNHTIDVPNVPLREDVDVHLIPDEPMQLMHIRVWWDESMVHAVSLPLLGFSVQFSGFPYMTCLFLIFGSFYNWDLYKKSIDRGLYRAY